MLSLPRRVGKSLHGRCGGRQREKEEWIERKGERGGERRGGGGGGGGDGRRARYS